MSLNKFIFCTKNYVCIFCIGNTCFRNSGSSRKLWSGPRFLQLWVNECLLYQLLWLYHSPLIFFRISLTLSLLQWFNRWHLVIVIPIIAISFFHHGEDVLSLKRNMNLCDGFIIVGFLQLLMFTENKFFWVGFCFYPLINDDICPLNHFIQSCLCTT